MIGACPVCSGTDFQNAYRYSRHNVVRCRGCGLHFVNPQLDDAALQSLYEQEYNYAYFLQRKKSICQLARSRIGFIERMVPPGRLLDIGCMHGFFLDVARARGWMVTGVERCVPAASYARDQLALDVREGTFEQLTLSAHSYDVVTLWHVFEHVRDPHAVIRRIKALLKPGGLLVMAVPNIRSISCRLQGGKWPWLAMPEHLFHYDAHTLPALLAREGVPCFCVKTVSGDSEGLLCAGIGGAIKNRMPSVQTFSVRCKRFVRPVRRFVAGAVRLLKLVFTPINGVVCQMGYGPELLVVARNESDA